MAWFDKIFRRPVQLMDFVQAAPVAFGLESPNQTSTLAKVTFSEYFTGELGEVSREAAMQIPALKKARDIYIGIIAGMPLKEFQGNTDTTPGWLKNTATGISPWHRAAYTFDDLFFYDWSAWAVDRDKSGQITDGIRVPWERWEANDHGQVLVDGRTVSAEQIILIPGNGSGGILACGASTIKGYRALERAWIGRAQNPIPLIELHQVTDDELTDGEPADEEDTEPDNEIQDLIDTWAAARTSPTGAVGFTDNRVEVRVHGTVNTDLYVEGRNAAVLDIARLVGMPAALLDGSQSTASLTYSTQESKRNEFDDYSLPMWTSPIEARLSLDDVSPAGRVIRFDQSGRRATAAPTITQPQED
ncbi:phage portal protein [Microbacterium allomyrinae]|uniref:Phage portal protein n=1 Tax=Microbacterium allomyrinae TaxID=2830666 RepID=A0A9X1LUR8_9MICO|nr:phage portal protein [Microbacterium allomyrinae]MCC2032192.1 hypothetical protein [Microbacterium allomyrinae]